MIACCEWSSISHGRWDSGFCLPVWGFSPSSFPWCLVTAPTAGVSECLAGHSRQALAGCEALERQRRERGFSGLGDQQCASPSLQNPCPARGLIVISLTSACPCWHNAWDREKCVDALSRALGTAGDGAPLSGRVAKLGKQLARVNAAWQPWPVWKRMIA